MSHKRKDTETIEIKDDEVKEAKVETPISFDGIPNAELPLRNEGKEESKTSIPRINIPICFITSKPIDFPFIKHGPCMFFYKNEKTYKKAIDTRCSCGLKIVKTEMIKLDSFITFYNSIFGEKLGHIIKCRLKGCEWEGSLANLIRHRDHKQCEIKCPNKGCELKFKIVDIKDHRVVCPYEKVACALMACKAKILRKDLDDHMRAYYLLHVEMANKVISRLEEKEKEEEEGLWDEEEEEEEEGEEEEKRSVEITRNNFLVYNTVFIPSRITNADEFRTYVIETQHESPLTFTYGVRFGRLFIDVSHRQAFLNVLIEKKCSFLRREYLGIEAWFIFNDTVDELDGFIVSNRDIKNKIDRRIWPVVITRSGDNSTTTDFLRTLPETAFTTFTVNYSSRLQPAKVFIYPTLRNLLNQ